MIKVNTVPHLSTEREGTVYVLMHLYIVKHKHLWEKNVTTYQLSHWLVQWLTMTAETISEQELRSRIKSVANQDCTVEESQRSYTEWAETYDKVRVLFFRNKSHGKTDLKWSMICKFVTSFPLSQWPIGLTYHCSSYIVLIERGKHVMIIVYMYGGMSR